MAILNSHSRYDTAIQMVVNWPLHGAVLGHQRLGYSGVHRQPGQY